MWGTTRSIETDSNGLRGGRGGAAHFQMHDVQQPNRQQKKQEKKEEKKPDPPCPDAGTPTEEKKLDLANQPREQPNLQKFDQNKQADDAAKGQNDGLKGLTNQ